MKRSTTVFLALLGTAGAGLAAYLLRNKPPGLRLVVAGAAFALPWVANAVVTKPSCVFLYVSDTHGSAVANQKLVEAMLTEEDVSFVVHGGDVADNPSLWTLWWDNGFRAVRERWPVYAASGNHDVETTANAAEFTARFGELPRSTVCGNAELFLMPWGVSRASAEWLWAAVQRSTAPMKILVVHRPVWAVRTDDARQRELLMPIMDRINLILAGHDHVYSDQTQHGVWQIVEVSGPKKYECPADARGCIADSTGYLRVEVYDGEIRVQRRAVE